MTSMGYVTGEDSNRMLLCRVTLGLVGNGAYGLRRPPGNFDFFKIVTVTEGYDSVSAEDEMYVVFDNHQGSKVTAACI